MRAILHRPIYKGELVWGKACKRDQWGQMKYTKRPEAEWVRTDAPTLRIVSDELWDAAHERLRTSRANYLRHTDGRVWGKPASGIESKYLLTGMATCAECGGGMQIYTRQHGRKRVGFYGCPRARVDLCPNDLEVPMATADAAALGMMADDVLSADVVALALDKLMAMLDAPVEDVNAKRARLAATLRRPRRSCRASRQPSREATRLRR